MSALSHDCHPQTLSMMHVDEQHNAEHVENLAKVRAEGRSAKRMQLQLKTLSMQDRSSRLSKSPVSPLQFNYISFSHLHQQHEHDHSFSSASTSRSWTSDSQQSGQGHLQFTDNRPTQNAYEDDSEQSSLSNNDWTGTEKDFHVSPRPISREQSSPPFSNCHIPSSHNELAVGNDDDSDVLDSISQKSPQANKEQSNPFGDSTSSTARDVLEDCGNAQEAFGDSPSLLGTSFALHTFLNKARCIQQQIGKSSKKLEHAVLRLPALELAMGPLNNSSSHTRKLCSFIDQTTDPAFAVLDAFKDIRKLTPLIRAGPGNEEGIRIYLEHVSRIETLLQFLHRNSPHIVQLLEDAVEMLGKSRVINKLGLFKLKEIFANIHMDSSLLHDQPSYGAEILEYAASHLESSFVRILAENSGITTLHEASAGNTQNNTALIPETPLYLLNSLAKKLISLGRSKNCLSAYEKARALVIRRSLKTFGASARYLRHSTPEAVQALQWETLEDHISMWVQQMEVVVNFLLVPERELIGQVFDDCGNGIEWQACFSRLALKGALQHWLKFGIAVVRSGKDPQKIFKLLDMFECMEGLKEVVEKDVLSGDECKEARMHMVVLQEELMKGASRVLRAFGSQVEGDKEAGAPPNGGVMKLTSYVVNYVNCLLGESYRPLIGRVMHSKDGDTDKLKAALLHLMQALERNLEVKAKGPQGAHPAFGQLFLMNNHWYVYTRTKNTELATILGTPWLKQHKQRAEKCAMRYRHEAWGTLLSILSGPDGPALSVGRGGVSQGLLRQNFLEFENAFAELYRIHQSWSVPDALLRPQLGLTILNSFVPMLSAFFGQFAAYLPAAHQMQYSPQRVQMMIAALFDVPHATVKPLTLPARAVPAKLHSFH